MLGRCIRSVQSQSYSEYEHLVVSDGVPIPDWYKTGDTHFLETPEHFGGFGAAVRQYATEHFASGDFLCFVDDDNIVFPDYLEAMLAALLETPTAGYAICEVFHLGPLPGISPAYLRGYPAIGEIDTLQVLVRREAMVEWQGNDYYSDGRTFEKLGTDFVRVERVLGVHL